MYKEMFQFLTTRSRRMLLPLFLVKRLLWILRTGKKLKDTLIVSERLRSSESAIANGVSNSKTGMNIRNGVLKGLIEWQCTQIVFLLLLVAFASFSKR